MGAFLFISLYIIFIVKSIMSKQLYQHVRKKQEIAADYVKGKISPIHMIEKYIKTFDLTQRGYVPFKLFPKQQEIIHCYEKYRDNVVTKPRQTGISTTTAAYLAVKAAYADKDSPETIIIIANKFSSAKKFVGLIRLFLSQLPAWLWGDSYDYDKSLEGHIVGKGSTETLTLVNGTVIKALATAPDALRGWTPTYLILDEAAYVETYAAELYNAAMAALSTGGKMLMISTPNGKDELYYKCYINAKTGKNGFNIVSLKWYQDPRYNKDLEWYKEKEDGTVEIIKEEEFTFEHFNEMEEKGYNARSAWYLQMCGKLNWDKVAIARELDVKFEGSAGTVVEQEWIEYQEKKNVIEMDNCLLTDCQDLLWMWEEPIEGHTYIMGVDVSSGNADDYSSIVIIDTTTGNQVLEFKGKIRPKDLAPIVYKYGMMFNSLTVVDTTGGYGDVLILKLEELEYNLLYYNKGQQEYLKKHKKNRIDKNRLIAGYRIGSKRPQIIAKFTEYVENNNLKIRSIRLVSELATFVWKNGRPDHMDGYNDDIIFAAALALWVLETEFKSLERAREQSKEILKIMGDSGRRNVREKVNLDSTHSIEKIYDKHGEEKKIYRSKKDPTGRFSWVFG